LFKLYNLAVPLNVRSAEAMTCDEWVALHHGSHRWSGSLFGAQEDFVWQSNDTLAALMEWRVGRRSQHFTLLVHPNYRSLVESLLYFVIGQARDRLPLYGTVRE